MIVVTGLNYVKTGLNYVETGLYNISWIPGSGLSPNGTGFPKKSPAGRSIPGRGVETCLRPGVETCLRPVSTPLFLNGESGFNLYPVRSPSRYGSVIFVRNGPVNPGSACNPVILPFVFSCPVARDHSESDR